MNDDLHEKLGYYTSIVQGLQSSDYDFDASEWTDKLEQLLNMDTKELFYEDDVNNIDALPDELTLSNFDLIYKVVKVPYHRRSSRGYNYEILIKLSDLINELEYSDEYNTWIDDYLSTDIEMDISHFPDVIHLHKNKKGKIQTFDIIKIQSDRIIRYDSDELRLFLLIE